MNFQYNEPNTFDKFSEIMNDCDDYERQVEVPQFYIYLNDEEGDGLMTDDPLWSCDFNKINDEESINTIMSYIKGEKTKSWIDDDEERWSSIELYFDFRGDNNNGFEYVGQLVDFDEIRKKRKECAIKYLKKVLPKYIRHHLYKPKAIMAKKAQEEFLNELEYGTKVETDSEEEN